MPVTSLLALYLGSSISAPVTVNLTPIPLAKAVLADETIEPLIPKPKDAKLDYTKPLPLTGVFAFPAGQVRYWADFKAAVARRFVVPIPAKDAKPVNIDGGVSRMHLKAGAYTIQLSEKGISVLGEEDEGLRNGMQRLARLVFAKGGRLWLPSGHLNDEPFVPYRGVELAVGPNARVFQKRLWDRVLLPLGFNQAVLRCELTNWKNTPLAPSENLMPREDLAGLFADYRKIGIEPTPLIDSFGHMDWFFAGGRRAELSLNPSTIDPRKPEAGKALEALWGEVADLLKPETMHFGCDDVEGIDTDLWKAHMAILGPIAKRHDAKMMLWGDMAMAPNEAPDNAHAPNPPEAALRRMAIPYGATIFDYHAKDDPNAEVYYPSYQLWKREDHPVIAAASHVPNNVAGVDLAAYLERVGTLQRVRSGPVSSEAAMVDNLPQFSALILAADYSWSGRQELPQRLPYDALEVFRRMYFSEPAEIRSFPGVGFGWSPERREATIGHTGFLLNKPLVVTGTDPLHLAVAGKGSRLSILIAATGPAKEGVPVAELVVQLPGGKSVTRRLVYGHHLREPQDAGAVPYAERGEQGLCAVALSLPASSAITGITVRDLNASVGAQIYGITLR